MVACVGIGYALLLAPEMAAFILGASAIGIAVNLWILRRIQRWERWKIIHTLRTVCDARIADPSER